MDFSPQQLFQNSFCIYTEPEEYSTFRERFLGAGVPECLIPRGYDGNHPLSLVPRRGDKHSQLCALSHYSLVKMAKTMELPHVTVFECDAYPAERCLSKLGELLQDGVPDGADVVLWGNSRYIHSYEKFLVDVDERQRFGRATRQMWGAHAYTLFSSGYDKYLNAHASSHVSIHADWWERLLPDACYVATKSLFIQVRDGKIMGYCIDRDAKTLREFGL